MSEVGFPTDTCVCGSVDWMRSLGPHREGDHYCRQCGEFFEDLTKTLTIGVPNPDVIEIDVYASDIDFTKPFVMPPGVIRTLGDDWKDAIMKCPGCTDGNMKAVEHNKETNVVIFHCKCGAKLEGTIKENENDE